MNGLKEIKLKIPFLEINYNFQVSKRDKKVAWELYCEFMTRIGVVEFVEDEDVIISCIDSWYQLFKLVRDSLKELYPMGKKDSKTDTLSELILLVLSDHLRPFLRKWQSHFRHYWLNESDETLNPIERQKKFPQYSLLLEDLNLMQTKLKETAEALEKLARC